LEEQLRQSHKMEAVGQLAGGIAHDFNNLLTIISGNVQLALETLPLDSMARDDIQHALAASHRAAQLTKQLLLFSRKQALRAEPVDIEALVEEVMPALHRMVGDGVVVERFTGGSKAVVIADRSQLSQALMNLALNARDAMPLGGTLRIGTESVRL